jgi:peroxin-16
VVFGELTYISSWIIKIFRAALRLALLHLSGNRPTIQPPIPEREVDPAMLEEDRKAAVKSMVGAEGQNELSRGSVESLTSDELTQQEVWRGTRTGYTRPTLSSLRLRSNPPSETGNTLEPNGIRTKHPLASSQQLSTNSNQGGSASSASDSDTDETLVDSWTEKDVNDYLLSRTLTPNDVRQPQELVRPLKKGMGYAAELIWILRPLLYGEYYR